ncbi:MAG: rRNA (guanosine-2-O-)-methyltransferase RlmB [Pseudomonadota bacterium]|jgi:23S rRNA (guanosine2251-2'-O)-methyltransferase
MANSDLQCLLGFHAVRARLRAAPETIREVWVDQSRRDGRLKALLTELAQAGISLRPQSSAQLDARAGGERHQGVLALAQPREMPDDLETLLETCLTPAEDRPAIRDAGGRPSTPFFLFLDGVTDPHNLGAILRTADAAGVVAVVAPKDHSAPLSPVAIRVAAGAAEQVPYLLVTNLNRAIEQAQDRGYAVWGLDDSADETVYDLDLSGPVVMVLGAEGKGLRRLVRSHCDGLVRLPMVGSVSSLNVSVACGVACYERLRQVGMRS